MTKLLGVIGLCLAALALVTGAGAGTPNEPTVFGVSDDYGKYADDGGAWFFGEMSSVGLGLNKMTVNWDPSRPDLIADQGFLDRSIPQATDRGIRVSLGISIGKARAITGDPQGAAKFTAFLQQVARRYPQVTELVVGNEPNLSMFWQPQFDSQGRGVSAGAYEALLARAYDALKAVNPNITVVGLGLSPRGNGNPKAVSNISTQPVKFIRDLGAAYRASGRNRPIMDVFGFHPYPAKDTDSIATGYPWPNAGVANLDRIKQAVWDAFHDTAQPTFAEGFAAFARQVSPSLTFKLDEVGWQVGVPTSSLSSYYGQEATTIKPTTEQNQARIYAELVRRESCDPSVRELLFFGLIDEPNLARWQAGMIRFDRTRRASYDAVKDALAGTGGRCAGRSVVWRHTEKVVGAKAEFGGRFAFDAGATEDVSYRAGLFRVTGPTVSTATRSAISRSLAESRASLVAATRGTIKAYWKTLVKLPSRELAPGYYVQGILMRAAMNPERSTLLLGRPFRAR